VNPRVWIIFLCLTIPALLSGCIEQEEPVSESIPYYVGFEADTLGRDVDLKSTINFNRDIEGPKLVLWVASGCSGCHDWTYLLSEQKANNSDFEDVNIVFIHRYGSLEGKSSVMDRYGSNESDTYAPWPILLPNQDTVVFDERTKEKSSFSIYDALNKPVTPTLQVIDSDGVLLWQSKSYWSNETVLQDAMYVYDKVKA
jgi:hypothetical protein